MINGVLPKENPPADYHAMKRELYNIGNNLNQLTALAHRSGKIDTKRFDEAMKKFDQIERNFSLNTMPEKIDINAVLERAKEIDKTEMPCPEEKPCPEPEKETSTWEVTIKK